jgi:hypothetical protein
MSEISLRANRLANEFESMAAAVKDYAGSDADRAVAVVEIDEAIGTVRHELTTATLDEAAELLRERGEGVTVSETQLRRFGQLISGMPYSGLTGRTAITDVDDLLLWLAVFGDVLAGVAKRQQQAERELFELQQQQRAMRSFLGLDKLDAIEADVAEVFELVRGEKAGA